MNSPTRKPIRIIISEEPVAQARARVAFCNGKVHSYTPEKSLNAQNAIRVRLMRYQDRMFPKGVAVKLTVCFHRTKSKWMPKYETLPYRKPDLDNMCKLVQDAMVGYLIEDDSQITQLSARKRWTDRETGYITIKVEEDTL